MSQILEVFHVASDKLFGRLTYQRWNFITMSFLSFVVILEWLGLNSGLQNVVWILIMANEQRKKTINWKFICFSVLSTYNAWNKNIHTWNWIVRIKSNYPSNQSHNFHVCMLLFWHFHVALESWCLQEKIFSSHFIGR